VKLKANIVVEPETNNSLLPESINSLPPESTYESREALLAAINCWAKSRGFAFTTGKSTKTPNGRTKVIFGCDRSGKPRNLSTERVRHTASRKTGCQYSVLAKESLDKTTWVLTHRPDPKCAQHNHLPSKNPAVHPVHRQLEKRDLTTISSLAMAGVASREIRTYLQMITETLATRQDITNQIATIRRDLRQGQSSMQALVNQLSTEGFHYHTRLDSDNRLTAIFFAHSESVLYLHQNPDILILDCTYKTNRYDMPLLDMIGVDALQKSFCIAFAFLLGESEEDYSWALQHLKALYQHTLPSVILID
jgi:hypothetical protein